MKERSEENNEEGNGREQPVFIYDHDYCLLYVLFGDSLLVERCLKSKLNGFAN
jgi:hypothetical protein